MLELISTTYSQYRTSHQEKLRLTYIRCWQPSLVGHHFTTTDTLFVVCNAGMVVESLVSSGIGGIDCVFFFFRRYSSSLHDMVNKRYLSTLALNIQPKMSYVFYNPCRFYWIKNLRKKTLKHNLHQRKLLFERVLKSPKSMGMMFSFQHFLVVSRNECNLDLPWRQRLY